MAEDVLVPLAFFTFLGVIIVVPNIMKYRDRARMHETLRVAFDRGQPVPPEMIEALQRNVKTNSTPQSDLRRAVILIGVALGLVAMSFVLGQFEEHAQWGVMAGATIPGFVGLGYLALYIFGSRRTEQL
jgi:hypothetical protein